MAFAKLLGKRIARKVKIGANIIRAKVKTILSTLVIYVTKTTILSQIVDAIAQQAARLEHVIFLSKLTVIGTIVAIDVNNSEKAGYLNNVGREIRHQAIAHGVLLRPLGNVLYLMPPYCITESELSWVYQQIDRVLAEVLDR
jgi:adenosylmethionine-8-amino-7-oxononanoate aminotransferase